MSAVIRDLWPEDIKSDDVISPEEILTFQAKRLEERTNGLLIGHIVKLAGDDRVILGFEVEVLRTKHRMRLFAVQHRPEFEYPVAIMAPDENLPDFLQERIYSPGLDDLTKATMGSMLAMSTKGAWIKNAWIASSPTEFTQKVEALLTRADVKAVVLSLLARATRNANGDENTPK